MVVLSRIKLLKFIILLQISPLAADSGYSLKDILKNGGNDYEHIHLEPLKIPKECQNSNQRYCTIKPDNYPNSFMSGLLTNLKYRTLMRTPMDLNNEIEKQQLWGESGCPSNRYKKNIWLDVTKPENIFFEPLQITTEECDTTQLSDKDQKQCFKEFDGPSFVATKCKQTYVSFTILVYNVHLKRVYYEPIENLPFGCSCYVGENIINKYFK